MKQWIKQYNDITQRNKNTTTLIFKKKQSITDENKNKIKDRLKKYNPTRLVKQQWPYKTKQN